MSAAYALKPVPFNPALLASTTAVEPSPLWVSGTSYAKGAKVVWTHPEGPAIVYHVFESLVSSNSTTPGADPLTWLDIGPCNKCAMFDSRVSTQTVAASPLVVVLQPGTVVDSVGVLNLIGNSITVEMLASGNVVYTKTANLQGIEISDWWDYYFLDDEQITLSVFYNLPIYYNAQIRITLTGGASVAIGHCVFGTRQDLGLMQLGATAGIVDYSRKETDEFGTTTFVERDYADEFSGQLFVENAQLNSVKRLLRELRATPTLYVGSEDERFRELFVAFGWMRSHRVAVAYANHSLLDIEIGALT